MSDDDRGLHGRRAATAAFTVLLILILITIFLFFYTRWKARLRVRRRYMIQHLNMGALAAQIQVHEPPKRGLDPSIIATLPIFIYQKSDPLNDNCIQCSVCLSALEEGEMARLLPNCTHMFHAQCINMWLHSHSTCPICRTGAEPLVQEFVEVPLAAASAPPLDHTSSMNSEGPSDAVGQPLKAAESSSR